MEKRRSIPNTCRIPLSAHLKSKISLIWVKASSAWYERLCFNILREICSFITFRPLLIECRKTQLTIFDPVEKRLRSIKYARLGVLFCYEYPCESACIGDDQIFICGGKVYEEDLETINKSFLISSEQATPLADMLVGRSWHGLYYDEVHRFIYAFGGRTQSHQHTSSCEEYSITCNSWLPLPNMTTSSVCTNPCGYQGKVYIGLCDTDYFDVFTIEEKQFDRVYIPTHLFVALLIVWKTELIVFEREKVQRLNVNSYEVIAQSELASLIYLQKGLVFNDILYTLYAGRWDAYSLERLKEGPHY